MLKITDKPQYEDYENTTEVMEMFRHAIHSDFALDWIAGALSHLDVQRLHNKALHVTIDTWFEGRNEDKEEFMKKFEKIDSLVFLLDMKRK